MKFYAVKHKTEELYLTGATSAAPRLYMSEGKAEAARKKFIGDRGMVVEWTISERVIPWQQELEL